LKILACFPDSVVGFIPDHSRSNLYFVKYALDIFKADFLAVTRGTTQDNLSLDKLLSFPIWAPPIATQDQIGGMLQAYDDLIEVAEHALAHAIGDKSEQAYRRQAALEKRRPLMEAWAAYCGAKDRFQPTGRQSLRPSAPPSAATRAVRLDLQAFPICLEVEQAGPELETVGILRSEGGYTTVMAGGQPCFCGKGGRSRQRPESLLRVHSPGAIPVLRQLRARGDF
jgi:hypothetical protein